MLLSFLDIEKKRRAICTKTDTRCRLYDECCLMKVASLRMYDEDCLTGAE